MSRLSKERIGLEPSDASRDKRADARDKARYIQKVGRGGSRTIPCLKNKKKTKQKNRHKFKRIWIM